MSNPTDQKVDFTRSGVARYIQLSTLFRRRIERGEWAVGQQIPTVEELAEEFGVARATIRQSLGLLEDEGLVSRFRARGTFVNQRNEVPVWCEMQTDFTGLLTLREDATIEILSDFSPVPAPQAPVTVGRPTAAYRHLRRRHSRNGQAYLVADVFIDAQMAKGLDEAEFTRKTALRLAASIPKVKITNAHQILTIGSADIETAEQLQIPLNAPVCFIDRYAVDQRDRLVLVSKGTYRGDVIRMDIKLR